jgi:hypothetical protein
VEGVRQYFFDPKLGLLLASFVEHGTVEIDDSDGAYLSRF